MTRGRVPAAPGGKVGAVASIRSCWWTTCASAVSGHSAASSARMRAVAVAASGAVQAYECSSSTEPPVRAAHSADGRSRRE